MSPPPSVCSMTGEVSLSVYQSRTGPWSESASHCSAAHIWKRSQAHKSKDKKWGSIV